MAPTTQLRDWFCLKNRATLTIDPKVNPDDAKLYFGRDTLRDRIKKQVSRAFIDPQVPKMMFYGAYGAGKTHTLYYLAHHLTINQPASCKSDPHIVHLEVEIKSTATAHNWHRQMMEALGQPVVQGWLRTFYNNSPAPEKQLAKLAPKQCVQQVLKQLGGSAQLASLAWRWLSCQPLSLHEFQHIGLTTRLTDRGVGDLTAALLSVGNLACAVGKHLVFFLNEMEATQNLREDAADSWHDYLRRLADTSNSSVGFMISFKADTISDGPRAVVRQDITSRIGKQNLIELETLAAPANVKTFVEDMLSHLIDETKAKALIKKKGLKTKWKKYPFTESAFDLVCDYTCQDPHKSTPRNIIRAINECAMAAWEAGPKKYVIEDSIVNEIAPVVFG